MLNDIFAERYDNIALPAPSLEKLNRFMMQASRMITDQLFPLFSKDTEQSETSLILKKVHSNLCMELGLDALTPVWGARSVSPFNVRQQTDNFLRKNDAETFATDVSIKIRLSFIELAFREYEELIRQRNVSLERQKLKKPNSLEMLAALHSVNEKISHDQQVNNALQLESNINELRERLRKAGFPLTYSNGYVQFSDDAFVDEAIKQPFWAIVADTKWANVEHDMLVAIDLRDTARTGAASSAAKALESVIKIISHDKGWITGNEKGAANFIDNLVSQNNGRFIAVWEANVLKSFFSEVRNKLQHGAGVDPILVLTKQQDDWAIETCMSWIRSLISRL